VPHICYASNAANLHLGQHSAQGYVHGMKIAKPIMIWMTPIGVIGGLYHAYQLAGGLVVLMAALLAMIGAAIAMVVATVRREREQARHG
jgi:hypothetical protein